MLTSNEPGVYFEGKFGVRLENLLVTVPRDVTEFGEFYGFETDTLCPFDLDLVDVSINTTAPAAVSATSEVNEESVPPSAGIKALETAVIGHFVPCGESQPGWMDDAKKLMNLLHTEGSSSSSASLSDWSLYTGGVVVTGEISAGSNVTIQNCNAVSLTLAVVFHPGSVLNIQANTFSRGIHFTLADSSDVDAHCRNATSARNGGRPEFDYDKDRVRLAAPVAILIYDNVIGPDWLPVYPQNVGVLHVSGISLTVVTFCRGF